MAISVETVNVPAVINQWGHSSRVDSLDVINLSIGLHGNLPITLKVECLAPNQAAVFKLELD